MIVRDTIQYEQAVISISNHTGVPARELRKVPIPKNYRVGMKNIDPRHHRTASQISKVLCMTPRERVTNPDVSKWYRAWFITMHDTSTRLSIHYPHNDTTLYVFGGLCTQVSPHKHYVVVSDHLHKLSEMRRVNPHLAGRSSIEGVETSVLSCVRYIQSQLIQGHDPLEVGTFLNWSQNSKTSYPASWSTGMGTNHVTQRNPDIPIVTRRVFPDIFPVQDSHTVRNASGWRSDVRYPVLVSEEEIPDSDVHDLFNNNPYLFALVNGNR